MPMTLLTDQSSDAIVQGLESFLTANGWTVEGSRTVGERYETYLYTTYGGRTYKFAIASRNPRAFDTNHGRIDLYGYTGSYNSGLTFENQANKSAYCRIGLHPTLNYRAFIFANSQYCALIVESATGWCRHLQFGVLNTLWTPGGSTPIGQFVRGSWKEQYGESTDENKWDVVSSTLNQFWVNKNQSYGVSMVGAFDVFSGQGDGNGLWQKSIGSDANSGPLSSAGRNSDILQYRRPDNVRAMLPIEVFCRHQPDQAIPFYCFGQMPGVFGIDAGDHGVYDRLSIGDDHYRLFPSESTTASTSKRWLAYKEI